MELLDRLIGTSAETIVWWQMVIRGILIFGYTLLLIRLGGQRVFGKYTSFDIVLGVILGSIMSRALTANAQFLPTLAAATTLVFLHSLLARLALYSTTLGHLIKGVETPLVENGNVNREALRRCGMTEHDLLESLRSQGGVAGPDSVKMAYLERSGSVSVVTK